ncbi:MAG: DUF5916 domain-containing protein [Bacteroidales bacterium]
MKRTLTLLMITALVICNAFGQEAAKRKYRAERIEQPPVIDGILNDETWLTGEWQGDFTQFEPYEGQKPSQPTEFKILYDDSYIYVAIKAYDSAPDSIVDRMTRRDNLDGDNVGIIFDSYYDLRTGFGFFVNSSGVKSDMIFINDGQSEDTTWDPIWFVKTARVAGGWAAEMKIPLTQLRFQSESSEAWGLEVIRQIYRHREMSFWQPIPRNAPGLIHMMGLLEGVGALKPRKQADITPYTVGSYERYQGEPGNPFAKGRDFRFNAGLDGKLGITNNITLDFSILPDFGQVEADPSQVNLTAFETFFQERRPFFIEGRNITSFRVGIGDGDLGNDNLFYSRRIGRRPQLYPSMNEGEYADMPRQARILGAVKITGKTAGGLSIGIVEAVTAEEKAEIEFDGERRFQTVEPMTNYFVSRVQKDFNKGNTMIGGVFTNTWRNFDESEITSMHKTANTGGIDFTQFFRDKNWKLSATAALSQVTGPEQAIAATQRSSTHYYQRPDADHVTYDPSRTSLAGHAGNIQFGKVGGNWNFLFFTIWKSPGFESNDLGYLRKADEIGQLFWSGYSINKPFGIFNRVRFNTNLYNFWDFGGTRTGTGGNLSIYTQFKNMWSTSIGYNISLNNQISNTLLRGGSSMKTPGYNMIYFNVNTDSRKKLTAYTNVNLRAGNEGYSGYRGINGGITYRPLNTLSVSAAPGYSVSETQLQYVSRLSYQDEDKYIFASLKQKVLSLSVRVNYTITPELSIQFWGQPFLAAADFSQFKMITDPKADKYSDRFHIFDDSQINYNAEEKRYYVDENTNGTTDYQFNNPDFNSDAFLSNLVVRWEFAPGSTVFLVWSQSRDYFIREGAFDVMSNLNGLFTNKKPYDAFLIKFSYRFGLR